MNNLTTILYDGYYRPQKVEFPSPTQGSGTSNTADYEQYGYDNDSNMISKILRNGQTVSFTYDALSRLTSQSFAPGASAPTCWNRRA